jgi:hypothetical protein
MNFYYYKIPKIPVGIVEKIDKDFLYYEPYRSFAHLRLLEDLELGQECECDLEDGRRIVVCQTENIRKLKLRQTS